jgi:hypothetical protein
MLRYRRVHHSVLVALAIILLAPLPGCDRNTEAPPPVVIVTPEPVRGVIAETSFAPLEAGGWLGLPIQLSDRGQLDVTVNWTHEDSWIYVYFGDVNCDIRTLLEGTCPFLIESERRGPKPRVLVTDILEPDTYYIYIYNVKYDPATTRGSENRESVRLVIGLTVGFDPQAAAEPPLQLGLPTGGSPPQL